MLIFFPTNTNLVNATKNPLTVRPASKDLRTAMIGCSVNQALRMAISSGGDNQYVGRSLKVNGPFCRDAYTSCVTYQQ